MANILECTPIKCLELQRPFDTITRDTITPMNGQAHASHAGNVVKPDTTSSKQPAGKSYHTGQHLIIDQESRNLAAYKHPHHEVMEHTSYVPYNTYQTTTSALSHMRR